MPLSYQSQKRKALIVFAFMIIMFQLILLPILVVSSLKLTYDHTKSTPFKNLDIIYFLVLSVISVYNINGCRIC